MRGFVELRAVHRAPQRLEFLEGLIAAGFRRASEGLTVE